MLPADLWTPIRLAGVLLPFLVILILMAGFRRPAAVTGALGWCATLVLTLLLFGGDLPLILVSQAKALWMALDVLFIVWGALLFHAVCTEAGVVSALGGAISGSGASRGLQVIAIAWVFASFLQGAGGFGVPVVVTAPLLMAMGMPPIQAILLPAIGHAWAVTFGSLGASFQALMTATGLPAGVLAAPAALLLGIACLACGLLVGAMGLERAEFRRTVPWILMIAAGMGATQYLLATNGFWQVGALGAGLAGLILVYFAGRLQHRATPSRPPEQTRRMHAGLAGYGLLLVIIVAAKLIVPIRTALQAGAWQPSFPETVSGLGFTMPAEQGAAIAPLGHAGMLLMYSALGAGILFAAMGLFKREAAGGILRRWLRAGVPVSIGILAMVGISTLMSQTGMTLVLAEGVARLAGPAFPLVSPWIGAAGAFLTGSNTNSNLLFAPLQRRVAGRLGLPEAMLLGGQTAGGAVGSVLSPAKVLVGAGAAGGGTVEGAVLRRLIFPVSLILILVSLVLAALVVGG
jgi:lactate permease